MRNFLIIQLFLYNQLLPNIYVLVILNLNSWVKKKPSKSANNCKLENDLISSFVIFILIKHILIC